MEANLTAASGVTEGKQLGEDTTTLLLHPPPIVSTRPMLGRQFSTPLPSPRAFFTSPRPAAIPSPLTESEASSPKLPNGRSGISDGGLADISSIQDEGSFQTNHQQPLLPSASFSVKRSALARMRAIGSHRPSSSKQSSDPGLLDAEQAQRIGEASADPSATVEESAANLNADELKQVMDRAIRYFNLNPKAGMKFLKEKRVTYGKRDPPDVNARRAALFLKNTRGLNKAKIGQFLGGDLTILREYVATFDFSKHPTTLLGVEAGLREFLSFFKPPGEGQQIDRILDTFASNFAMHCEPALSKDMIHQIAFVIILANVTLHNPNMRGRHAMTREEFVATYSREPQLRECGTKEEYGELYDRIQKNELKHEEDREDLAGNLFTDPDMSGWLEAKFYDSSKLFPRLRSRWVSRWVILSQNSLYYFKKSTDVEFEGFIPLENVRLLTEHSGSPLHRRFHSQPPQQRDGQSPVPQSVPNEPLDASLLSSSTTSPRQVARHSESAPPRMIVNPAAGERGDGSEEDFGASPLLRARRREDEGGALPRLARLVSCPAFRTSQSSLNTATTSAFSNDNGEGSFNTARSLLPSFMSSSSPGSQYLTFILAPTNPNSFLKSARLERPRLRAARRNKSTSAAKKFKQRRSTAGEVVLQQNVYVGFRTKSQKEYDDWVRILNQVGLRKSRAGFSLPKSGVPAVGWGGGRGIGNRFKLFSPTFSLPASFSADEEDAHQEYTMDTAVSNTRSSVTPPSAVQEEIPQPVESVTTTALIMT